MRSVVKCHPIYWEQQFGIKVHDPDGWDRSNFAESWAELITAEEFADRAWQSTCSGDFSKLQEFRSKGVSA